jgi:hypothetical protein
MFRGQFLVYLLFLAVHNIANYGQISGVLFDIISNFQFWLTILITVFICVIPIIVIRRLELFFAETLVNNLRYKNYEKDWDRKNYIRKLNKIQKFVRTVARIKKLSVLDKNYEPDNLADKKLKNIVETYRSTKHLHSVKQHNDKVKEQKINKNLSDSHQIKINNEIKIKPNRNKIENSLFNEDYINLAAKKTSLFQNINSKPQRQFEKIDEYDTMHENNNKGVQLVRNEYTQQNNNHLLMHNNPLEISEFFNEESMSTYSKNDVVRKYK